MKRVPVVIAVLVFALALLPLAQLRADAGSWTGWITDESCGAKDANAAGKACVEKCMKKGDKLVFYNGADKKIYKLDNQDLAAKHIGHEVTVSGDATGDSIKVTTIEKSKAPAK
ncbi:MAG TPA: hypothetical protein VOA87_04100 [Thermoanaerobaculia bacterium]|nr:hypothetical protein [Thermoanaerobaculia bacterium]